MKESKIVVFSNRENAQFFSLLRTRVNQYFKESGISRFGDRRMAWKTAIMISWYMIPYFLILFEISELVMVKFLLWIIMGMGLAGVGLSVMHDAAHGAYSSNKRINSLIGNVMTLIGGSKLTWDIQHNKRHHSFTNVDGIDEDIDPGIIMRFSPHKKRYFIHRFQHFYAWLFYGIMTITWSTEKDFRQLFQYRKQGALKNERPSFSIMFSKILFSKLIFHSITVLLPFLLLSDPWELILLYIVTMHYTASLVMACVFQPAHVMPEKEYPLPDEKGSMENNWAIHQLLTTSNFAPNNRFLSWYIGGLNYQIEHHLFPNICHIHYREISKIVRKTVSEFNLPYHVQPTFLKALKYHAVMLKNLGRYDGLPALA